MKRFLSLTLCAGLVAGLGASALADGLKQSHPAKLAPALINDIGPAPNASITNMDHNEYPWFTNDGRLFFWTRQINPTPGTQWIWVSYLRNRDDFNNNLDGSTLPDLDFAPIYELGEINHRFEGEDPPTGVRDWSEIKAFAVCEDATNPAPVTSPTTGVKQWRYRLTFYLAVGPPEERREMWRVRNVVIKVRRSDGVIDEVEVNGNTDPVIPDIPWPAMPSELANETEPFFTPNGRFLFWGSNAWAGGQAKYIESGACFQIDQTPTTYLNLPTGKFAWVDQYDIGTPALSTSRTNYHSLIERSSDMKTALIFEECQGQVECSSLPGQNATNNRDCACEIDNQRLSTTGFGPGDQPSAIENMDNASGNQQIWKTGTRTTHPAVSGPQNLDQSWLLFFMRGKKIWYTKVKEDPPVP